MAEQPTEQKIAIDSPITLPCGVQLPNRLAKAAMTECLADELSRPTAELFRLYETWSRGGTGLLITGNVQIDRRYVERPGNVAIDGKQNEEQIQLLKQYALSGQKYHNSKIFVQISHGGRQSNGMVNMSPIGPGNIGLTNMPKMAFGTPRAMSINEIIDVKQRFVYAAEICQQCGFNGIQIHGAHGYLLSSFMNPIANNRHQIEEFKHDKYAGSLENRCRLLLQIVTEMRESVGDKFPIAVKLNSADFQKGGFTPDECVKVALFLEEAGVDLLELSGGNYDSNIYREFDIDGKEAELDEIINKYDMKRSTATREAYYLKYCRDIIDSLKLQSNTKKNRMCIMCTGGFRSKRVILEALNSGGCDIIGIGRPLCGKPDGSMELIKSTNIDYCLPRYESTLVVGLPWIYNNFINNKKGYWAQLVSMLGKQSWYYVQLVQIGKNGNVKLNYGCFAALIANYKHEQKCAADLIGIKAVGSVYNKGGSVDNPPMIIGKKNKSNNAKKLIIFLSVTMLCFAVYYYKYH